jgi:hypothetical protein
MKPACSAASFPALSLGQLSAGFLIKETPRSFSVVSLETLDGLL